MHGCPGCSQLLALAALRCPALACATPTILQVYGLPVPEWASDAARTAEVAAGVPIEPFVPQENVKIETGGY